VLFWSEFHVAGDPVDILVSPKSQKTFKQDLKRIGINKVKILFSDLSKLIEKQGKVAGLPLTYAIINFFNPFQQSNHLQN